VDVFDDEVLAECDASLEEPQILRQLSHWPLTTAEVIINILNATGLEEMPMAGADVVGHGTQIPSLKILLDKYENHKTDKNVTLYASFRDEMPPDGLKGKNRSLLIHTSLDFGSGELRIAIEPTGSRTGDLDLRLETKVVYTPILGSYEWITVGRNRIEGDERGAANVDSVAAAMITQAFDSLKNIPVWLPSLDVQDPVHKSTISLLSQFNATDDSWEGYMMNATGGDMRSCLKDDWSSSMPIASSNIITVGGPVARANLVSEYFNEFLPVIFRGMPWFNDPPMEHPVWGGLQDLLPVSDWDTNPPGGDPQRQGNDKEVGIFSIQAILDSEDSYGVRQTGFGVIGTYYDINGTVGFVVYGMTGDDTFWLGTALWSDKITVNYLNDDGSLVELDEPLIVKMQTENAGIVAYVLELDYSHTGTYSDDIHPEITIVEKLGTISEKPQHDP
jgi:hypothetical protein